MRILMVGAGAVGGLFGSYLHRHGARIDWLVRPARKEQLADGLTVKLPDSTFGFNPSLRTRDQLNGSYDLIVLTNKAYSLGGVIEDIRTQVSENTLILPLLNGIRHLDILDAEFGRERVLGGIAKTIATLATPSEVLVNNNFSSLTIGARTTAQRKAVDEIVTLFSRAGISIDDGGHIMFAMWDKFCRMAALGAANCLLQGTVGEYMRSDEGGAIALKLFDECTRTADAGGYPMHPAAIEGFQRALTNPASSFNSSMYRDMCNGLSIEGDHLVGDMLRRARSAGTPCEMLRVADAVLQTYSARNRSR